MVVVIKPLVEKDAFDILWAKNYPHLEVESAFT